MANEWDYAELSKRAKAMGGPETLIKTIHNHGFQDGILVGQLAEKAKQNPKLFVAFGVGVLVTIGSTKLVGYFKDKSDKKKISDKDAADAERILIQILQAEPDKKEYLIQEQGQDTTADQQDAAEDYPNENICFECASTETDLNISEGEEIMELMGSHDWESD